TPFSTRGCANGSAQGKPLSASLGGNRATCTEFRLRGNRATCTERRRSESRFNYRAVVVNRDSTTA
nr:hypothetical protein [Nostoc sp. DedQUE02]